jgi:DNA-binding response OmpR family regulator
VGEDPSLTQPGGLRALVIDDERAPRSLLVDLLTLLGGVGTVDVAPSGEAGLALFDRNPYDLVLTDFRLPGLTGPEVVEALRRRDPAVRIVMLVGPATDEDVIGMLHRGVTILTKPVFIDRFRAVIGQILHGETSEQLHPADRP